MLLAARVGAALLVVLAALTLSVAPAPAATSIPPTSSPFDVGECVGALPNPECGTTPEASGDRGGSAQLLLFGMLLAGLAVIGTVVVRSTRRATAARRPLPAATPASVSDPSTGASRLQ